MSLFGQSAFRILPYLQNPAQDAITVIWFSEEKNPGVLTYGKMDTDGLLFTSRRSGLTNGLHNQFPGFAESPVYPGGVFAAGCGEEGLTAAAALDLNGDLADH